MAERLKFELGSLKDDLTRECDDILTKIDDLLSTEIMTFEKAKDFRQGVVEGVQSETEEDNFNFYELE